MRKFFFQLHLYAAIIVCPFLLIFAITGSLMAFEPEIDHLLHAKLSYVEPAGKQLSLAAVSDKVHIAFPKRHNWFIQSVRFARYILAGLYQ